MIDSVVYRGRIGLFTNWTLSRIKLIKKHFSRNVSDRGRFISYHIYFLCLFILVTLANESNYEHDHIPKLGTNARSGFKSSVMGSQVMINKWSRMSNANFYARYTYGNKKQQGIKIMHWNKGSSLLKNKMDEIMSLIDQHRPHILGLSEANFHNNEDRSAVKIPEYELITCPTINNPNIKVSRVVVYVHNSVVIKPRPDLMNDQVSAIWLEVGLPHKRKFILCNVYREWGHLGQMDRTSHSRASQLERLGIITDNWQKALNENKEVILLGDMNINSLKWTREDLPANDSIHKQRPLIDLLFEKIISQGVSQQVSVPTHGDNCLDHIYTNMPEKLSCVSVFWNGGSDHKLLYAVRSAKSVQKRVRYVRKRCFKKLVKDDFVSEVKNTG